MNRDKRIWNIICLITAFSVFFVLMTEARPSHFSRPLVRRENVHVLTAETHVPDLAFFWDMNRKVIRYNRDLSDTQKARMKEEFWKVFIHAVVVQEDSLNKDPGVSDKKDSALQRETFSSTQHIGQLFAGYLKATDDIFTPEQQKRRHAGTKRPGRSYVVTNVWAQPVPSSAPVEIKLNCSHFHAAEETAGLTRQFAWAALAQASLQTPLQHDLSQLQILRL